MRCARCGSDVPDGARFCAACEGARAALGGAARELASTVPEGALFAGRYLVRGLLAEGAAGPVLRARDQEVDLEVAVKLFDPALVGAGEQLATLKAVVDARKALRHASLPRIYEFGVDAGRAFYTTPFLDGLTLREVMDVRAEKGLTFALSEALPLLRQLAEALGALEGSGAHGTVRPTSVIVLSDGLELTGSAHLAGLPRGELVARIDQLGDLAYLAPEAREPDGQVGPQADVYSLAAIATEMLAGIVGTLDPVAWTLARERLAAPVAQVLERALARAPGSRPQHATEVVDTLAKLAVSAPGLPVPIPRPTGTSRPRRVTPSRQSGTHPVVPTQKAAAPARSGGGGRVAIIAGAAVLVLGAAAFFALRSGESSNEEAAATGPAEVAALATTPGSPKTAEVNEPVFESLDLEPSPPSEGDSAETDARDASGAQATQGESSGASGRKAVAKGVLKLRRTKAKPARKGEGDETRGAGGEQAAAAPSELPPLRPASPSGGANQLPPPPPPPPPPPERPADVVTDPVFVSGPRIDYPLEASRRGIHGEVRVTCVIGADGHVRDCRVIKSLPLMDAVVVRALEGRVYEPARRNGQPVDAPKTFSINVEMRPQR